MLDCAKWKHGLPEFVNDDFPHASKVCFTVKGGEISWVAPMRAKLACSCSICHHTWPISKMVSQNTSIDWGSALDSLPVITEKHYHSLLRRRGIKMSMRSLGRYLSLCLPRGLLERLGIPRK